MALRGSIPAKGVNRKGGVREGEVSPPLLSHLRARGRQQPYYALQRSRESSAALEGNRKRDSYGNRKGISSLPHCPKSPPRFYYDLLCQLSLSNCLSNPRLCLSFRCPLPQKPSPQPTYLSPEETPLARLCPSRRPLYQQGQRGIVRGA